MVARKLNVWVVGGFSQGTWTFTTEPFFTNREAAVEQRNKMEDGEKRRFFEAHGTPGCEVTYHVHRVPVLHTAKSYSRGD